MSRPAGGGGSVRVAEAVASARRWVRDGYGGLVDLIATDPAIETDLAWVFGCRTVPQPGYPDTPMLNAGVVVPKNGSRPFHLANDNPWQDLADLADDPRPRLPQDRVWRTNARGCVVAADAAVDGYPASALPWQPADEAPGWWERLVEQYFPDDEVTDRRSWEEVIQAVAEGGADTRGVVWVRRAANGIEVTGTLLYVHNNQGDVVVLDPQTGDLAELETTHLAGLLLARFQRARPDAAWPPPWTLPTSSFDEAAGKARDWLAQLYGDDVVLVHPSAEDELRRGWLFACTTARFQESHDWRDQMLNAGLVVPKDEAEPFFLPNSDPWPWLEKWDSGVDQEEEPPDPEPPYWFADTFPQLGPVLSSSNHSEWPAAVAELAALPDGGRALVWVRRRDRRGRETVGMLLNAANTENGLVLVDSMRNSPAELKSEALAGIHLVRYR